MDWTALFVSTRWRSVPRKSTPVRGDVGEPTLQKNVGVVCDDRVNARGLIAGEDDTREHERDHVLAPQERVSLRSVGAFPLFRSADVLHLLEFEIGLRGRARAQKRGVCGVFLTAT